MTSKAKTFRNIIYTSFSRVTGLVCVGLTSFVVARNLSPSDYGVLGFATIIIGFLTNFSDVGVGNAAIRRPSLDQESLQTAFTLKVILSSVACVAAFLIAPFAHLIFEHPATGNIIRAEATIFLISTIGFMPSVMLAREQNFRRLALPGIASAVVRCLFAVILVLHGWRYWAVILADIAATFTLGLATQLVRKIPMRLHLDLPDARAYLRFDLPLLGSGVLVFILYNLDNFLVGSVMGSTKLGYYALAYRWGCFVSILLADTVNNVLLPTFSSIQNNPAAMRRWYLKTVDLYGFVAVVVNTALLANAHFFLVTFLGKGTQKWMPAALSLEILCLYGIIHAITHPLCVCIMSLGQTSTLLRASIMAGAFEVPLLLLVLRFGRIELIAVAVLISYATQVIVWLPYLRRNLDITARDMGRQLWPMIPALVGGCALTSLLPASLGGTLITFAARGLFTASVVALIHGLCTRFRCFQEAGDMILQNFARISARSTSPSREVDLTVR
jgi:O-antigen/teichoic acid export membrane protein